jgi:hypothetical protein
LWHLDVAVLHQGFPETATPPAVRAVRALLAEGRAHPEVIHPLIEFLGSAGRAVTNLGDNEYFAFVLPDLADAVAEAYPVVLPALEWAEPEDALFLAENLVAMARAPSLTARRGELAELIRLWRDSAAAPRADWVRLLGRLGEDVDDELADPDPAVRLRAALANQDGPVARSIILAALREPMPPGTHVSEVVAAAIQVADSFDEIAEAACAVVARARWMGFDHDWGQLVAFAFRRPYRQRQRLTDAQRALLRALAANPDLWDPKNGSVGLVYQQAGLPYSRNACRRLADQR